MEKERVSFEVGNEVLKGIKISVNENLEKGILFLHGAGGANKERALPIAEHLGNEQGINSFLFDFSGHGESTGELSNSSLSKRLKEAKEAIHQSGFKELSICAFSMGGHIALELLGEYNIHSLNLFYPGVYTPKVFNLKFKNPIFTALIRVPESWRSSLVFKKLNSFKGNLLVVYSNQDTVIPRDVIDLVMENAESVNSKELLEYEGPHVLLSILYNHENKKLFETICTKVAKLSKQL